MTDPRGTGNDVVVRAYRTADYERVMELWREGGLPLKPEGRDSRAAIERQIAGPSVVFLVAEAAGRVVGTVMATHDGRKGWINRLAVAAALRRRGLGRRLVLEAETRLAALGLGLFACLIEAGNDASMQVFERLGYIRHPEIIYFAKRSFPGA